MDTEYIHPTKGTRIRVIAHLLAVIACLMGAGVGMTAYSTHVAPMAVCDQVPWLRFALALLGVLILVPALTFGRTAWNVYVHRQFPAPGASVFFRTKVQRGLLAAVQGISALTISAGLFFLLGYIATSDTAQAIFFGTSSCGA